MGKKYDADIDNILAKRHDNGGDFWASSDARLSVGNPFSTLSSLLLLHELGLTEDHEAVTGAIHLVLDAWREDGRYRLAPGRAVYPCATAEAARVLCRYGYTDDPRIQKTFSHFIEIQHNDGGWRCNKFMYGRGPETEFSNPGVTLAVLDAFRFSENIDNEPALDRSVESLLGHWVSRKPTGPCHFGIGKLFMQVEYPFLRYNLFYYVYVLSFYARARSDRRYLEALGILKAKLDEQGRLVVERPHQKLSNLQLCRKGQPSEPATGRYLEILGNLKGS